MRGSKEGDSSLVMGSCHCHLNSTKGGIDEGGVQIMIRKNNQNKSEKKRPELDTTHINHRTVKRNYVRRLIFPTSPEMNLRRTLKIPLPAFLSGEKTVSFLELTK